MSNGNKTSTTGFLVAIAALLVSVGAYYADLCNVPVLAPWLDWLANRIYGWLPILERLVPQASMVLSAIAVGFAFFVVATVLTACFFPSSRIGALEIQMRGMQRKRRPRSVKVD
jgi:uncharacterized protein involved in cysteine biosynthesis